MSKVGNIKKVQLNAACKYFGPDSTVSEIADLMDLEDIGAVPIINEKGNLLGVLSERDIVRKLVKSGRDSDLVTAKDIMTTKVISVSLNTSLVEALKLLKINNIRHLPIVDDQNCLINFISHRDIINTSQVSFKFNWLLLGFAVLAIPAIFLIN